jgi:hypothetical protein
MGELSRDLVAFTRDVSLEIELRRDVYKNLNHLIQLMISNQTVFVNQSKRWPFQIFPASNGSTSMVLLATDVIAGREGSIRLSYIELSIG